MIGNVVADPEVRALEGGAKVARVRMATNEKIFNRQTQESREHTEYHTITLWRGLADVVDKYVKKGSPIYIEGRLRTREWEDQARVKHYTTEIVADEMKLLGRKPEGASAPAYQAPAQPYASPAAPAADVTPVSDPDDLPF